MHSTLQFYQPFSLSIPISKLGLKRGFWNLTSHPRSDKKALFFSQIVVKKFMCCKSSMKYHKLLNPKEEIQSPRTGEAWRTHCTDKQRPTADPKLNPEPATKLTEQLVAGTVHGHAPIHSRSINPGLNVAPLGERRLLVTAVPLGEPCFPNL